jgi:pimeloyl-ACP methyl ester carboxylesterase
MSTFVLVHGAWHGGWCWKRVATLLRAAGHEAYTPTLTGLGERVHLMSRAINLQTHIDDVVNLFHAEELSDAVLCGHSYGGMVITGVADRVADKIRALVYLDAFLPADGQCLLDFMSPERVAQFRQGVQEKGSGWLIPPISAAFFKVNAADQAWVDRRCVPHPLACFEQKIALTGAHSKIAKRSYVLAGNYSPSPFGRIAEQLRQEKGWQVTSLASGHDVMLDMPKELADLLTQAG